VSEVAVDIMEVGTANGARGNFDKYLAASRPWRFPLNQLEWSTYAFKHHCLHGMLSPMTNFFKLSNFSGERLIDIKAVAWALSSMDAP
jgi:hypothetical protein